MSFDFSDTEAYHLGDIYSGFEGSMSFEEEIAEAQYQKANTLAILSGLDSRHNASRNRRKRKRREPTKSPRLDDNSQQDETFLVIQDSRKDNTTLMLADRRKTRSFWWTHDFSIALKGKRDEMQAIANKLRKNNVRIISYNEYFRSV